MTDLRIDLEAKGGLIDLRVGLMTEIDFMANPMIEKKEKE
jgi:hypothetical protein